MEVELSVKTLNKYAFHDKESGAPYLFVSNDCRLYVPVKNTDVIAYIETDFEADYSLGFSGGTVITSTEVRYEHELEKLYLLLTGVEPPKQ